ncbi:MAG: DUF2975 domain-containing protein [Pseudomonadota bacterium]
MRELDTTNDAAPGGHGLRASGRAGKVRAVSRVMAMSCLVLSVVIVAAVAGYWLFAPWANIFAAAGLADASRYPVAESTRVIGLGLSLLPVAIIVWGLMQARTCFRAFAAGDVFSAAAAEGLRGFSVGVLVSSLLSPFVKAALTVLLTWNGAPGTRTLAFSLGSDTIIAVFFGATVLVMAWVMSEAVAMADENKQIV